MKIYRFFWSSVWQSVRVAACWLFISLGTLDVPWRAGPPIRNQIVGDALSVTIFCIDATMRVYFTGLDKLIGWKFNDKWFVAFIVCLAATVLDLFSRNFTQMQWSGCLRPFIILYYSESSRISFMVSFFGAVKEYLTKCSRTDIFLFADNLLISRILGELFPRFSWYYCSRFI